MFTDQAASRSSKISAAAPSPTYTTTKLAPREGPAATLLGYDGQYTNSDTGLIYMRARTYDPATAQFLTGDPLVVSTGAPYTYASDNPINQADPTGLCNANPFSGSFWTKGNGISDSPLNPIPYYVARPRRFGPLCVRVLLPCKMGERRTGG